MKVRIKETAKEKKGWSMYRLAMVMDMPPQSIYSWASGRTQPGYKYMDRICTLLECSMSDLFIPEEVT